MAKNDKARIDCCILFQIDYGHEREENKRNETSTRLHAVIEIRNIEMKYNKSSSSKKTKNCEKENGNCEN